MVSLAQIWHCISDWLAPLADFYATTIRGSIFTSFLTLSGFLLSAMTFIVVNMKKDVYDQDWYKERVANARRLADQTPYYAPLAAFSKLLINSVFVCLFASVLQLTVGMIPHGLAALFCIAVAVYAIVRLVYVVVKLKAVIVQWLDENDKAAEERVNELLAKSAHEVPGVDNTSGQNEVQ